jgi:DNA (cytosine-5)-methyltransferase 1
MADALGWGYTRRPSPTLTGGGTYTGGPEPFGNGTRQAMRKAMLRDGEWAERGLPHLRPTVAEAAVLQGFPVGYPWFGRAGQVFQQCGNAIPVPLAAVPA